MITVARFNVTPVKSTSLQHPDTIQLGMNGVEHDRRFSFLEGDGSRPSGVAKAPLLGIDSSFEAETDQLTLRMPGGSVVAGEAAGVGEPFGVSLFDREVLVREVPGPLGDAVSTHVGRRMRLVRVEPGESAGGRHRVSMVSLASVDDLGRRAGRDIMPDPRRFRMLIELEGCLPYEEDDWSGELVKIGGAVMRVGARVPRCVLTTMDPDTGEKDFPTLEVLADHRRSGLELVFGVYADVEQPGLVRVSDVLSPYRYPSTS